MKKLYFTVLTLVFAIVIIVSVAIAIDPPHETSTNTNCKDCHTLHNARGVGLTREAENYNLCKSCHKMGGSAFKKPFKASDQAIPGETGTSHKWTGTMPLTDNPNNPFGLRSVNSLSSSALKQRLGIFGTCSNSQYRNKTDCETNGGVWTARVVCSVCHSVHFQSANPWDPFAPSYDGSGTGAGRHFLRDSNDLNQLCEDCHYYRTPQSGQTNVRQWDGKKKSHPIIKTFTNANGETRDVAKPQQFHTAPLEPEASNWAPQSGARYHLNGGSDANLTNNIVVDKDGKIRCLSCHGVHFTDSNSNTIDKP
jgi:predicted CXXCH cytochrome family protein